MKGSVLVRKGIAVIILLLVFISSQGLHAQGKLVKTKKRKTIYSQNMPKYDRKLFHFGINLGVVSSWLAIRPIADYKTLFPDTIFRVESVPQMGFTMGIESNLRLSDNWDLRFTPQLSLTSRRFEFYRPAGRIDRFTLEQTLIDFPVYFKFKSVRLTNFRMYIIAGAKYSYDISHKIGADDATDYPVKLRPHDVSVEVGIGMDFYLPYFKFSTQLKTSWGLMNLAFPEDNAYNKTIQQIYARSVFICFLFE